VQKLLQPTVLHFFKFKVAVKYKQSYLADWTGVMAVQVFHDTGTVIGVGASQSQQLATWL
jgi:hypothetical protein